MEQLLLNPIHIIAFPKIAWSNLSVNGKDHGSVWRFRDITEIKKAQELEKKLEMKEFLLDKAKEYDEIKTNFFSTISHEFKTPLNIILGTVQLLTNMYWNTSGCPNYAMASKYMKMMTQNCNRLLKLINNIVDITKIDSGFMEMYFQNLNIVSVIEDITLSTSEYAKSKDISVVFDTNTEELITACDSEKLERVMLNLLSNGIKFTEPGGVIEVNLCCMEKKVRICVKDTGIGIPENMIEEIFDRFRQVDSSLRRKKEGSGIGLSIVKSIIELHGGTISLKSQMGKGSEFIIELPIRLVDESLSLKEVAATNQSNVERINIEFSDIYS